MIEKEREELEASKKDGSEESGESEPKNKKLLRWDNKLVSIESRKLMFKRQMKFYLCFSSVLVIMNVCIQVWGRFVTHAQILGCADGGFEWLYTTTPGELFITAQII